MTTHHLINIILNYITPCLHQAMAHYEDLRSDPSKWKEKLLHMDFITTKFQKKKPDNRSKGQEKKRGLEEQEQLRGGEDGSSKKKYEFVFKEVWDKGKIEARCMKCGRNYHEARDCKPSSRVKTPLFLGNTNKEPVQKKKKFNKRYLKITELSSEEDLGNE